MKVLEIGKKIEGKNYSFRRNCFGIVDCGDKFLLVYTHKDKNHSLPGGGVEEYESPEEAIKWEFIEEAGFSIAEAKEIVQVHCYWNWRDEKTHLERFSHIFVVKVDEKSKINPLEDWHTRVYVDKQDAINLVPFPYQKTAIEYYLKNFKS